MQELEILLILFLLEAILAPVANPRELSGLGMEILMMLLFGSER